jgi:YidC/Oxa1 family membrane protein insertase
MDIWGTWLELLRSILTVLSSNAGLGVGVAVVVATVLLRAFLLPLAWPIAYRAAIRQKKMLKLQPELRALQERFRGKPDEYLSKMTELYKANDLAPVDAKALLAGVAQLPLFLGMFQVLRSAGDGVRFLWIANLLRPDVALAVLAGLTTALLMAVNPDLPEHIRIFMIVLPSIIAVIAALQFSSALAIYWSVSNLFSAAQTVLVHAVVRRRIRAGLVHI